MLVSMSELREKVIRGLECVICPNKFCGDCSYFIRNENDPDTGWCNRDAIYKDALSLLKKQEPKPPRFVVAYDKIFYACDNCGKSLIVMLNREGMVLQDDAPKYCPECGQEVKWS